MARETIVRLTDDLDGSDADETVGFALDGRAYEIDLNEENASTLREMLAPYIAVAAPKRASLATAHRVSTRTRGNGNGGGRTASRSDLNEIREWARAQGHAVSDRGRIKADLVAAYDAAQ